MDAELFDALESRVENLLREYASLREENSRLRDENQRLLREREGFKSRIDAILKKMEGV